MAGPESPENQSPEEDHGLDRPHRVNKPSDKLNPSSSTSTPDEKSTDNASRPPIVWFLLVAVGVFVAILIFAFGCKSNEDLVVEPDPTRTPRPTYTPTPRPTSTPRPTPTPLPTATPVPKEGLVLHSPEYVAGHFAAEYWDCYRHAVRPPTPTPTPTVPPTISPRMPTPTPTPPPTPTPTPRPTLITGDGVPESIERPIHPDYGLTRREVEKFIFENGPTDAIQWLYEQYVQDVCVGRYGWAPGRDGWIAQFR